MSDVSKEMILRTKMLYAAVCRADEPDGELAARYVQELEQITGHQFKNTIEFHHYVSCFLKRKQNIGETLGGKLRRMRKRKKLSQKELSSMFSVTPRTIIRWERDEITPSAEAIKWAENAQNE